MTDKFPSETRTRIMRSVRSKDTEPERIVRSWLHGQGFRFRLHRKDLPGKPDLTLARHNLVIFVNGCFWHRHKRCKRATMPATNVKFWQEKFDRNVERDRRVARECRKLGWRVATIWECEIRSGRFDRKLERLLPCFSQGVHATGRRS